MEENVIEFLGDQEMATVSFSKKHFISKIKNLVKKYPDECEIIAENKDGSICAHVPVSWVRITHPKIMTDENKQKNIENIRKINENRARNRKNKSKSEENDA